MKTEILQARFTGDEYDARTHDYGLVHGGVYSMRLMHPSWWQRLFGEKGVVTIVRISGKWQEIFYESIDAFDRNWALRN